MNSSDSNEKRARLLSRRNWIAGSVSAGALAALAGCVSEPRRARASRRRFAPQQSDLVLHENQQAGTRDWMLAKTAVEPKSRYRCPWIEGYCSRQSVRPGETIEFFVSTNPASRFTLDLYRMGYYGGEGGRHLLRLGPLPGEVQPDPPVGPNRVRECRWAPSASLRIPADWVSGVYLGKLTAERGGWQSYVIFILRDDRRADFAFQCWWGDGLSEPPGYVRPSVYTSPLGPDPRAQRITQNILDAMRRGSFPNEA